VPVVTGRHATLIGLLLVFLCVGGAIAGALAHGGVRPSPAATGTASSPPTSIAEGLGNNGLPAFMGAHRLATRPAPGFSLVDQSGATVSLRQLRGRTVVLTFLDDASCTWLCPVVPEELRDAAADLGPDATRVAFVAVSVDAAHDTVGQLASFSSREGLSRLPRWTFLTGPSSDLERAWREYGVSVDVGQDGAMTYTGAMYFITPHGREAYVATPYGNQTAGGSTLPRRDVVEWGKGIALLAERAAGVRHA
jgi:cytochrome oxidase Cu insertion factor (SCO1/SenC/PrrC family)